MLVKSDDIIHFYYHCTYSIISHVYLFLIILPPCLIIYSSKSSNLISEALLSSSHSLCNLAHLSCILSTADKTTSFRSSPRDFRESTRSVWLSNSVSKWSCFFCKFWTLGRSRPKLSPLISNFFSLHVPGITIPSKDEFYHVTVMWCELTLSRFPPRPHHSRTAVASGSLLVAAF